ncbi:beta-N-acetylhexosaminidase [Maribellus luteus]|uniref:beta-N-acetylhexosaminidase n=1 Tax=Maribellus luteus TaxID=2305463 RepID=A0A399SUJ8_9BACT|nr:family 20 glycosylhydrolase [Maribellus luteus]RIJ46569.1 beta-N-acetylhexosaminidase [Maribellus luteus]
MKKLVSLLFLAVFSLGLSAQTVDVIPQPAKVVAQDGHFTLTPSTKILFNITNAEGKEFVAQAQDLFMDATGFKPEVVSVSGPAIPGNILVQLNNPLNALTGTEGYLLRVEKDRVFLNANTTAGLYYGVQTLWQMLTAGDGKTIPCVDITDYPRLSWRGMMLDVSRHYFPVEFIYRYIDYLAMHKMNVFHWHLVDDQGWRIEIKKYPKLTEIGAFRADRENLDWNSRKAPVKEDEPKYGGFYTQEQIKSVVEYARQKHVTVVPEIEMPAHAMAALAAYPELSCTGEYQPVPSGGVWPITHIFCAGKEQTFNVLEDILKEVMDLFPSTFIHIGGDEATKTEWEKCELCQKRMKDEQLADEHELQAYFIKRIEKFLNSYGRQLIGWDEILEGGLNPSATIMSWRGTAPGIEAAKAGHDVVMSPTGYCYFDYYQGDPSLEPKAFGGNITLKKVYSFDPVPEELTAEEGKHIIGVQANLWTEHIPTPEHAEYMILPRMTALSEVAWSPKDAKDWGSFSKRMESQYKRFEKADANYATSAFQVKGSPELNPENRSVKVTLSTEAWQPEIRYTTDGSEPGVNSEKYAGPFEIQKTTTVKAVVVKDGQTMSKPLSSTFYMHKAIACRASMKFPNSKYYNSTGEYALVDGIKGSSNHGDGHWKGFNGDDLVATLDLGKETSFSEVTIGTLQNAGAWIFYPTEVTVESSNDGLTFRKVGSVKNKVNAMDGANQIKDITVKKKASARFVRVTVKNLGTCPQGHAGEGKPAWLFVDEISVE